MRILDLLKNPYLKPFLIAWFFLFLLPFGGIVHADGIPTINVLANGTANSLFVSQSDSFSISWTSSNVLTCELSVNGTSAGGVNSIGQTATIDQTHPYFPQLNQPTNFTVTCTDGTNSVFQSVVVSLTPPAPVTPALSAPILSAQTSLQCGGRIDLTWNAVANATSYSLSRDGSLITQSASTTFSDNGIAVNSSHIYTVVATNSSTSSPNSLNASAFASDLCPVGPVAQTTFNLDPLDYPTVLVSNFTQFPFSISNWGTTATAQAGDIVAVGIYYHNSGLVNAINTKTSISIPLGVSQSQFTASGGVSADNASAVSGSATISISSNRSLSFVSGSARWYPNQIQDPAQGIALPDYALNNLGTIAPGFPSQGIVVAHFQVSNNTATSSVDVTANNLQGPVTITPSGQFTLEWTTSNVISCSISSTDGAVVATGITLVGNTASISSGHPYFPATGTSRTFNVDCLTATGQVNDSVTVSVQQSPPGIPATPTGVQVVTGPICGGQVSISWTAVSGATSYKILRDGGQIGIVASPTTSYVDTVNVDSVHSYSIIASNSFGDSVASNTVNGTGSSACPSGPVGSTTLSGAMGGACGGEIVLSWTTVVSATNYKVFRIFGGVTTQIATTTNLSFTDTGLTPSTMYQYYVVVNAGGIDSSPSNVISPLSSAQCPVPPPAPVLNGATGATCGGQIVLNWNNVSTATSYNIFRGGSLIATTTNLSFTDTGLTSSTAFSYTIQAVNSFGTSVNSNTVSPTSSATCGGGGGGATAPTITLVALPNPIFVGATTTLTWTSTNSTICNAIGGWTIATTTSGLQIVSPATTTSFVLTCAGAGGSVSATTTVVVLPTGTPVAPANLVANTSATCGGQIDLTWSASVGASFYNILRAGTIIATTTNLSFTDTGLTFGQSYSYTVQAVNSFGTSANSNTASASASAQCGGGSGGGGGSTSSGGGGRSSGGSMPIYTGGQCSFLKDYLRITFQNNPVEMIKLQLFLKIIEGEIGLEVNGFFDQATFDAVSRFQVKHQGDILTPWGYAQGEATGYVYILTQKKINEIVCNKLLYLSSGQLAEIDAFNAFLTSLNEQGITLPSISNTPTTEVSTSSATTTGLVSGIVSKITDNENVKALAAVVFASPHGLRDTLKAMFIFLLVLVAAYVAAEESLKRFLKTDDKNIERLRRLIVIFSFLVASIVVASILKYFVIVLPTIILLIGLMLFASWIIFKQREAKSFRVISESIIITPPPAKQA